MIIVRVENEQRINTHKLSVYISLDAAKDLARLIFFDNVQLAMVPCANE